MDHLPLPPARVLESRRARGNPRPESVVRRITHGAELAARLDAVTVYCIEVEQLTGKKGSMPALEEQWPAKNKTLSPQAVPPGRE